MLSPAAELVAPLTHTALLASLTAVALLPSIHSCFAHTASLTSLYSHRHTHIADCRRPTPINLLLPLLYPTFCSHCFTHITHSLTYSTTYPQCVCARALACVYSLSAFLFPGPGSFLCTRFSFEDWSTLTTGQQIEGAGLGQIFGMGQQEQAFGGMEA